MAEPLDIPLSRIALLELAREAYEAGTNVTQALRRQQNTAENNPQIIEIAYDLQAGSYVAFADENIDYVQNYTRQLADNLRPFLDDGGSILDVGCGESTNLVWLLNNLGHDFSAVMGCDISWSRLSIGRNYAAQHVSNPCLRPHTFMSDIGALPLRDKSVDYVISNHALEPNHGRERELLAEIFRVGRKRAILFEPSYEIGDEQARSRMNSLGYIRGLREAAEEMGGRLEHFQPLSLLDNPLNPTVCHVFVPPASQSDGHSAPIFADPGTDRELQLRDDSYFSPATGLSYPIIGGIPVLRLGSAVLTSARSAARKRFDE